MWCIHLSSVPILQTAIESLDLPSLYRPFVSFSELDWINYGSKKIIFSFIFYLISMIYQTSTGFKGYRYFWASLYSLFSTSFPRFWIISYFTLPPYFLYGQSSTSLASAGWTPQAVYCRASGIFARSPGDHHGSRQESGDVIIILYRFPI